MDTLDLASACSPRWLWSLYALFLGDAGDAGHDACRFDLMPERGGGADEIYLEVAAGVTVFILAGRYFEARAKRRAGAALRALLELGAKDVAVLDADGARAPRPGRAARRRRPLRRAPRREGRHRRRRRGGRVGGRRSRC